MKKMWKRFVSLLLACTLLAGMLPLSASAAEKPTNNKWVQEKVEALNAELGDESHQYELDGWAPIPGSDLFAGFYTRSYFTADEGKVSTTVMFIAPGDGGSNFAMPDYSQVGDLWVDSGSVALYIANGVTEIGNHAFDGMSTLETIEFENSKSLTKVGEYAFNNCDKMVGLSLDLSNVTTLGKYAFNGCERLGSGENNKGVTLSDELTTIPENAFNTCGLKNVNIPKSCTKIEKNAFAHNSLSEVKELVLPDGLQTIGDSAFVVTMGSGTNEGIGITSLTIPSSVKSIGANAFSGRRNLAEVTVEDDNKPGTKLELGNHAFGYNESSAFSEWGSITDNRTGQIYEGTMGTKFYLPKDLVDTFENGVNCYTGDIEPMKWVKTQQPTCDTDGWHLYETTMKGAYDDEGKPLVLQYKYTIPMLGHDWDEGNLVTVAATCETPSYKYEPCTRGCGEINIIDDHVADALSHNYQVNENGGVMNPGIKKSNNTPTTVTYTCQNYKDGDGNLHDGDLDASYTWTIPATTLSATTSDTLADLQLPSVTGSTQASLAWADSVTTTEKLTEGTSNYQVKLVVSNDANFKPYTNADFTIEVKVEKTKLDFSEVYFENSTRWINGNTPEFSVEGMPEGTSEVKIEYKKKNEENAPWTTEKPKEEAVGDAGDYLVRYTFSYDPAIYDLVTNDPELSPPDDYTLEKAKDKDGEGTITGDYRVAQMTMESVKVSAINNLVFNGTHENIDGEAQPTVQLEGVLLDSKVTFTWTEDEKQVTETIDPTEAANFSGAKITNAGTYKVAVKIEKENYVTVDREVFVTIAKQPLTAPRAESNLRYDTTEKTGVPDSTDNRYTVSGNKQTNAGTYKAEAKVVNSKNYQWPEAADPDGDGTAEISWQILHRLTAKPTIPISQYQYEEETYRQPVTTTSKDIVISYEDDKLVATFRGQTAYTATNAKETNADDYTVTVHLENNNYKWADDQSTTDLTLSWRITPLQIAAPTITAPSATYTGEAYAGQVTLEHSKASDSRGSSQDIIDLDKTKSNIRYYTQQTGGNGGDAPVNAGTYYAGVENWAFADGKVETNYQIIGGSRAPFSISKATATMTFDRKEVSAPYTTQGTDLQKVTVSGLVGKDAGKDEAVKKEVKYSYKYSKTKVEDWTDVNPTSIQNPESQKFIEVGYYQITAKWGAGTVSNNYTATDATYTLTITQAEDQSITLTPDNKDRWTEAKDQTPANYTITYGQAATFKVIGTAALDKDHATISYTVKEGSDVVSVDSGSGVVTIKQAGTATITVTAAETPNVGADSVDYTVTVEKATPALELDAGTAAYTGSAVAADVYQKATLSGAGDGYAQPDKEKLEYYFYTYGEGGQDTILADTDHSEALATPSSVGTYWLKVVFPGDACYSDAAAVAKFTITPAELSVSATGHTGTYDGSEHKAITIKSVTGNDTQLAEGNYTVKYATTETNTPPKASDGVWQDALSVKDVADSSSDTLYYWYMVTADNYNPAIGKVEVKITPAPLTVAGEPTHYTKEYDGDKTVDETFDEITVTAEDVPDVTISVAATGTYDNENAGKGKDVTLTLTLSGTEIKWDNYSYNGAAPTDGKITLTQADAGTITPKEITVTGISAVDRVYDGTTDVELKGTPETTDKVGSDDLTLTLTSNATGSIESADVGNDKAVTVATSVITLGGTDANNYKVSAVKDAANGDVKVNITQRPVNLEFAGIGQDDRIIEKAYTGQPVNVTVGPVNDSQPNTGFVKGDTLNAGDVVYTYSPEGHTAVGSYTVTAALKENPTGNYDNYQLNFPEKATLKITPAEMVVTAEDYTSTYTGKAHDVTASWTANTTDSASTKIDITKVEFIKKTDDDTRPEADAEGWSEISFTNVADSGEYWYKVTAQNYAPMVGEEAVTITINPATLTITRTVTPTKTYDGTVDATNQVTGYSASGVDGETIEITNVSASYDDANAGTGKTITITYTLSTKANLGNYKYGSATLSGTNATVTETVTKIDETQVGIAPAEITVTIKDQQKVYDGVTVSGISNPEQDKDWSTTGTIYSQNGTNKDDLDITLTVDDAKKAGTYAITGTASNQNYEVTFTGSWTGEDANNGHAGTYTISPRPIDVQIGNAEGFYGDAPVLTGVGLTYEANDDNRGLAPDEENVPGIKLGTGANEQSPVAVVGYTIYAVNDDNQVALNTPTVIGNYKVTFTKNGTYTVNPRPITITIEDKKSDYGCDIAQLTYNGTLSNTYTGSNKNVVFVGDDEDELGITLSTTAKKGSDAGTYPISGEAKAESSVVSNYAITWKGETPYQENEEQATYTVKKATLAVEFTNEEVTVSMGGTVNNPLKFINQSNSDEELGGQPQDVTVKYSSNDQGVATVNETTGEITLVGTGNATITAEVTSGGKNFTEGAKDSYIIHVAEDGGLLVTVTPKTLTYTGEMQNLISYSTAPAGAEVTFKVEAQTEGDRCQIASDDGLPQGQDAGTYRVSWVAKLQGYRDATGSTTVTIAKASPTTGFSKETVSVPYEENGTFDSTEETTLNVADDYKGTITYMSNDTRVASVQGNSLENISLNGTGSATITAVFTETDNYTAATASFRITVGTAETTISYTAEDYSVEYDRIAHGSKITVKSPSEYTIMYSDNNGTSYDLNESPTITDAGDLTIYFQIQADGYNSASGTQKVTVEPKEITANMVTGIAESYTYTGKEITFDDAISVHDEGVLLEKDKDYTITYDDNKEVGQGSVTITGRGNYKGSVTKNFTISPVDASDLTASLNRTFGYYGDSYTNNATVKVMHGNLHEVDSSEIELTVTRKDDTSASSDVTTDDLKLTFNKAGIYTIHVEVSGTHTGTFDLTYTLLPQDVASDDFQVATDPVDRVWTYDGENHAFGVTVTSGGTSLQKDVDFTLHYTYLPYVGNPTDDVYDPGTTAFTEAGIYTVIVEGTGNYTGHAELVALIQPRDLSDAGIAAAIAQTGLVYNGEAQEPDVTLTYNGAEISQLKDTEYYGNTNAGEAQALSAASEDCNNFTGARVDAFTIEKKSLKDSTITAKADPEEYYYTGYPVTPAVTVTDSGRNVDLSIGADYTVTSDAVGPGKVTATVTGTGNYKDTVTVEFTILPTGAEPVETLNLTVTPSEWTWDNGQTKAAISVTFNGKELNDTDYQLTVSKDGETPQTVTKAEAVELLSAPGEYTITATGVGAYNGSTDTETVTIQKIQPEVTVTATPNSLSGGGKVTLTLKGEKLPDGMDLKNLLKVTAKNDSDVTLEDLHIQWPQDGSLTAELTLPNTNETYTFTLSFVGNDYYESASSTAMVVVGQQTSGGGGGSDPGDQPADPDDTGVSDWLNTKEHLAYLAGYPGGTFGPDQNMTRAEAAQMFYNLLLEKDVEITVEFEDVPADAWYAKPVNTLASLGILSGVGNGRFDPERSITRAEFTVIAMKFANTSGGGVNIFSDVNEDDWFYSAVVDSTQYGWINGYPDGTFRPEATISRAEVTVIVNHMLGRAADRPYVIAHEKELNTFGDVNRGHWGYFHIAEATNAHEYHTEDGTESWTGLS